MLKHVCKNKSHHQMIIAKHSSCQKASSKTFKTSAVFTHILLIYSSTKTWIETIFLSVLRLLVLNKHEKLDVDIVDSF